MPFSGLVSAQQVEVAVSGPGDVTRLYVCKGLATGSFGIYAAPQQGQYLADAWQFEVGPQLQVTQFRRAIATVAFAGLNESDTASGGSVNWQIQNVIADFDDDAGMVRVTVTNQLSLYNPSATAYESAGISTLSYDVSILAALA